MKRVWLAALASALTGAAFALGPKDDQPSEKTLVFGPQKFIAERVGTFTYLHCAPKDSPDCVLFEKLEIQPQFDWARFEDTAKKTKAAKAKKKRKARVLAQQNGVDQHGGIWIFARLQGGVVIVPDFKAYRVTFADDGALKDAEVVGK